MKNSTVQNEDLESRLQWMESVAHRAGDMMREYAKRDDKGVRLKLNKTQVTDADEAINDMVIKRAQNDFPEDGVLGEEASSNADRKQLWVCDPIDFTDGFILGLTGAMFSLAYVVDGEPQAAVMYEPVLEKMYAAIKGRGALENGEPIHVSRQDSLEGADISYSPSFAQVIPRRALYQLLVEAKAKLRPINGEAYRGGLTATGMLDAHLFAGRSAHDVAAVKLVVEEAGGKVTDLRGKEQRYDSPIYGAIVSNGNPQIHDKLVELLEQTDPENYIGY